MMNLCCGRPRRGHLSSSGKRRLIRGGELVSRISNEYEPQFPVVCADLPCPAAREVVDYCIDAVRHLEPGVRQSGLIGNSFQYPCYNSDESDDDVLSVGVVLPLLKTASMNEAETIDISQRQADVVDDVLFLRNQGLVDSLGTCCARMDDFD